MYNEITKENVEKKTPHIYDVNWKPKSTNSYTSRTLAIKRTLLVVKTNNKSYLC